MPSSVETRYARAADGTHVAYQVTGEGPVDLVWVRAWHSNIEHEWDEPVLTRMIRRLGSIGRVIRLDRRGTGLSDRVAHRPSPTIEDRVDDIRAVMDAAGSRRAALIGLASGGQLCAMFAAAHPERAACLILYHTTAGRAWGDDSAPPNDPRLERFIDSLRSGWGTEAMASRMLGSSAPSRSGEAGSPAGWPTSSGRQVPSRMRSPWRGSTTRLTSGRSSRPSTFRLWCFPGWLRPGSWRKGPRGRRGNPSACPSRPRHRRGDPRGATRDSPRRDHMALAGTRTRSCG